MGAASQYATTGHIDWGLKGVAGAALAGAVGAATGIGVGAMAAGWGIGAGGAAAVGGAAGGAMGGATGTAVGGGSLSAIGSSALTGAICGAVGGAVGVWAGSTSSNAATAFGGSMAGTGAGTSAGIGWGALTGDAPTWQSAGIAFGAAFGGAIASTALSSGVQAMAESYQEGSAELDIKAKRSGGAEKPVDLVPPDVPTVDRSAFAGAEYGLGRQMAMGHMDTAVKWAAEFWKVQGLDMSPDYGGVSLDDPATAGLTSRDSGSGATNVTIYEPGMHDSRELLSTMYHEGKVHAVQAMSPGQYATRSNPLGMAVNECQAYGAEIALSRQLGLSDTQVAGLRSEQAIWFNEIRGSRYESRVRAGNYALVK